MTEKGRLKLSDRIFGRDAVLGTDFGSSYPERVQRITLENLLTHTCGGWDMAANDPMFLNPGMNSRSLIRWTLQNQPLQYDPGRHYPYSNFAYCIFGPARERIGRHTSAEFGTPTIL